MWVQALGWEDPLEEGMVTHSSVLAWKTPCKEEPGGLQSMGSRRVDTAEHVSTHWGDGTLLSQKKGNSASPSLCTRSRE